MNKLSKKIEKLKPYNYLINFSSFTFKVILFILTKSFTFVISSIYNLGIGFAKKKHIPCIATMHSQFKQDFERAVKSKYLAMKLTDRLIKVFNQCDECWAVNSEVARIFHEEYHYKQLPRVMNNATEMLPVKDEKYAIKYVNNKYHLKKDEIVFLFVGRINILKNILFIADAIKIVKQKKPKLKFKMLYVGSGQDEDKLRNYINKINIIDNVILCGKIIDREELGYHFKRANLFLFPSIYDASSIVQIEAASQGTPGLFLKDTATAATITDNINGFLADNDVNSYADKIIEIVSNKSLYSKVCHNAYNDLYKSWDDKIDEVYKLYLSLIENNKRR